MRSQFDFLKESIDTLELEMLEDMADLPSQPGGGSSAKSTPRKKGQQDASDPTHDSTLDGTKPPTSMKKTNIMKKWSFRKGSSFAKTAKFPDPDLVV